MADKNREYKLKLTKIFEVAKSGDAVLLGEVLQQMNSHERASALDAKMSASVFYDAYDTTTIVTSLILAVKYGNIDCVRVLLKYKADIDGRGDDDDVEDCYLCKGCTPLFAAAARGNFDVVSCLVENGADVNACTDNKYTPLMMAIRYGHKNVVTFLILHGTNVDLQDKNGDTALHYAVRYHCDSCDVLSCLVKNGADVNACTNDNCTPLMIASKDGLASTVTFLIKLGAKMDLHDKDGQTALHYAVFYHRESCDVLSCLIKNGANVNACTNNNYTPLMIASENFKVNLVTFLVDHGANLDIQDDNFDTALHYAVKSSAFEVVCTLLTLGASQLYNNQGLTPLLLSSDLCKVSIVKEMINRPTCTKKERIDALELIGASFTIEWCSFWRTKKGFEYMKHGMKERFQDPSHPLLKQPMEPVEAYQNRKESQTPEELARIRCDINAIIMESLIIRERILGTNNAELLGPVRRVAQYYHNNDIFTCIELYRHAMKIAQHCNESAISDLNTLTSLLSHQWVQSYDLPREQVFLELLEQAVIEYERQQKLGREFENESQKFKVENKLEILFHSTKNLVKIIAKFKYCEDGKISCVLVLLKRLCRLNPRDCHGDTLLHKAVVKDRVTGLKDFPCTDTVKLLLNAGLNVNAINNNGDTPLHIAVTFVPSNDNIHLLTDMLEVLLDEGAHHDFVNNDGKTAMGMAKTHEAHRILLEKRKLELKCISARAVRKFGLHYLQVVPKTLEKYISMH